MDTPVRYLITSEKFEPFFTNWWDYENNYDKGMTVYDLHECKYSKNGKDWYDIEDDHL